MLQEQDRVYTGIRRRHRRARRAIVELHDATEGRYPVRLTPMAVQEVLEALAQALVQIRGRSPPSSGRSTPLPQGH